MAMIEVEPVASDSPETQGRRVGPWIWLCILAIVVGGIWVWANRLPADTVAELQSPAPAVGHPAPQFTTNLLDGSRFDLGQARGTPVVLNFWATWCGPCRSEMPALQRTWERYAGHVMVAGIDQGESTEEIQKFVDEMGITFPVGLDEEQTIGASQYNVTGLPTTFFIDADGVIQRIWMGEMNSVTMEEGIAEILR